MATSNRKNWFVPKPQGRHVIYLRRSASARSKLSIDEQWTNARRLLATGRGRITLDFIEEEPLQNGARPALEAAIEFCLKNRTRLILGQFDGMRGAFRWLKRLHDARIYFMAADVPAINPINFFAIERAEADRRQKLSVRMKLALVEAKASGAELGGRRADGNGLKLGPRASAIVRQRKANSRASFTMSYIREIKHRGVTTLSGIALRLNQMKHPAPRGGQWSAAQVRRVINRFET